MDMSGYTSQTSKPYGGAEVVDHAAADHDFANGPARALIVTASGNVKFRMAWDGTDVTLPVAVTSNHYHEIRGYLIDRVYNTGTTGTVAYGML